METLRLKTGAHVELFKDQRLVYSSRPDEFLAAACRWCGEPLGVTRAVVLTPGGHAHQSCVNRRSRRA